MLGLALGGFFDGILLHQILQWHHLFSLVPGVASLRAQMLWDGYFHAMMYVLAIVAMWGLWRSRRALPGLPAVLIGFGVWHMVDALLSHWVLGIHRVRLDSPNPLLWDLLWLGLFGIMPLLVGLWWQRGKPTFFPRTGVAPLILLFAATTIFGVWAAQPPPDQRFATVVFAAGTGPADVTAALDATGHALHGPTR